MALTFLLITVFVDMLGLGILIPVIPFVVAEFSPGAFTVGALSMAFALFQFIAAPVLGALSDRLGRRPLLLVSLTGSGIGYVVFGLAQSLPMLFAARIVDGASGGNNPIASVARGLAHPDIGAILIAMFAFGVAFTGLQSNLAVFTRVRFGWGPGENAVLFSLLGVMAAVSQAVLVRKLTARFGDHRTAVGGLTLQALAYLGTSLTPAAWLLFGMGAMISLGVGVTTPTLQGIVPRRVPDHEQGAMLGTTQAVSALTRIVGPLWAGVSFDWLGSGAPYWSGALLIIAAATLVTRDATRAGRRNAALT